MASTVFTEPKAIGISGRVEDLENMLDQYHSELGPTIDSVKLDMSGCEFIQLEVLVWLIALLNSRERASLKTQICLPCLNEKVRDFMWVWEFPRAVRDAVGRRFETFLDSDDLHLFLEDQRAGVNKLEYAGRVLKIDGIEQRLLSEGFFEFTTFVPKKMANPHRLAEQENGRWRQDRILSVLRKNLTAPATTVSSHIIHEAMMNCLRHAGCRLIQTASFFNRPDSFLLSKNRGIIDWRCFFKKINHERTFNTKTPGTRLWELLPEETQMLVKSARNGIPNRKNTESDVIRGLNEVLSSATFYDEAYFHKTPLSEDLKGLVVRDRRAFPLQLQQKFNRQLLEAAFPAEVFRIPRGHLTICFWDDGESVVDTLKEAIIEHKTIRSMDTPELYANYELTVQGEDGKKSEPLVVRSDFVPNEKTQDELVLLAATFPGITRDVTGAGHIVDPDVLKKDHRLGLPGMGLYVLTSEVVEVYGGTVSFRTKNYFLNIKGWEGGTSDKTGVQYMAKVRKYGEWLPPFQGNMVTIRLPLR